MKSANTCYSHIEDLQLLSASNLCWELTFFCVKMRIEGLQALKPRLPSTSATETDLKARSNASGLVSEGRVFQDSTFGGTQAAQNQTNSAWSKDCEMMSTDSGMGQEVMIKESPLAANPSVTSKSGFDVEVRLVEREDDVDVDIGMGEWRVESFKAAVSEPVIYSPVTYQCLVRCF